MPQKEKTTIVVHCKDAHHDRQIDFQKKHGWNIELIPLLKKGYSGTKFHKEFPNGRWRDLVPNSVIINIEKKINKKL